MELKKLKEEMMAVEEKAALYLSDLNSYKSQNADVDSTFKELQNKLELCEKEKVLFLFFSHSLIYNKCFWIMFHI